jgi:5-methylcytosine-specific restriction endonuclease McrA
MYRSCGRCGKIHPAGYRCNEGRIYRGGEERRLRNKYAWAKKAQEILKSSHYMCAVCRDQGVVTTENLEVHHIEKLSERPDLLLEDDNLICLCQLHHKAADRGLISQNYLRNLAQGREE